jgi:DNA-binding MurR/RpiR family transcriptional regulator
VHHSTVLLDDSGGALPEDLAAMRPGDALIAVSFPRYVRRTVQAVEFAAAQGVRTIALTDSFLSPISNVDVLLPVQHFSPSFFNSNVAATAVINALAAELAARSGPGSSVDRQALIESFYEMTEQQVTTLAPRNGSDSIRSQRPAKSRKSK